MTDDADENLRVAFAKFYRTMPDTEREAAIWVMKKLEIPPSEEFLKAYTLGCWRTAAELMDLIK